MTTAIISFDDVTIAYDERPVISRATFEVHAGELALVVGPTGSGKTTILRAVNGLVPHFTGGRLDGRVTVAGRSTRDHAPRDLADVVGIVTQDPMSGFVTDIVEDELAYSMECLGVPSDVMRRRVEETLDIMGLAAERDRPMLALSAGQRQRVAIGAALTAHPQVLVLDEPTSALDPSAAEEVLAALHRLVHDLGMTVLLAEHRLERVVQYADRVIVVPGIDGTVTIGNPATMMADAPVAPPVVQLGRLAGWDPLPLSVREARRQAEPLRGLLTGHLPPVRSAATAQRASAPRAAIDTVDVRYGRHVAVRAATLTLPAGEIVALMGRNGAGKSSLLAALVGLDAVAAGSMTRTGSIDVCGIDPSRSRPKERVRCVGLVPQEPADLLQASTIAAECRAADRDSAVEPGTTRAIFALLAPDVPDSVHPRDLSEGQRLELALAIVLAARPQLLLLDEPTRGLDYATKARLGGVLRDLAQHGHTVVLATHDVELAAEVADRVVVMAQGEIVTDGPAADVLVASPMFAPQVAKVLSPLPWLTVRDVAEALGSSPGPHERTA